MFLVAHIRQLRLRDGRVIEAGPGNDVVVHELRDEDIDLPELQEPHFCSRVLIGEAFQRHDPSTSFGWGGDTCTLDQTAVGEVLAGADGAEHFIGFLARANGLWAVLELIPVDLFQSCEDLTVDAARQVCFGVPGTAMRN